MIYSKEIIAPFLIFFCYIKCKFIREKVHLLFSSRDDFRLGGKNDLNVGRRALVSVDTTVGTVGSSSHLGSLVDLDVLDVEGRGIEALGLSVGKSVLDQVRNKLDRLNGPSSLGDTKLLTLGSTTNATVETTEGNGTLLLGDSVEVLKSLVDLKATDGGSSLTGVLERNTEVRAAGLGAVSGVDGSSCVTSHCCRKDLN